MFALRALKNDEKCNFVWKTQRSSSLKERGVKFERGSQVNLSFLGFCGKQRLESRKEKNHDSMFCGWHMGEIVNT